MRTESPLSRRSLRVAAWNRRGYPLLGGSLDGSASSLGRGREGVRGLSRGEGAEARGAGRAGGPTAPRRRGPGRPSPRSAFRTLSSHSWLFPPNLATGDRLIAGGAAAVGAGPADALVDAAAVAVAQAVFRRVHEVGGGALGRGSGRAGLG